MNKKTKIAIDVYANPSLFFGRPKRYSPQIVNIGNIIPMINVVIVQIGPGPAQTLMKKDNFNQYMYVPK